MTIDFLIRPFVYVVYSVAKRSEKQLGFRVEFEALSDDWIPAMVKYKMDKVWQSRGLAAYGVNYFTMGAIKNGVSSRFIPESSYYQSWLGCYLVQFDGKRSWEIDDHFALAKADQENWLTMYGVNNPKVSVDVDNTETLGPIEISGFLGTLYRGNIYSDSDVNSGKISLYNRLRIAGLASLMKWSNTGMSITDKSLLPSNANQGNVGVNNQIKLRGYIAIINVSETLKAVLYANAAIYEDANAVMNDNFALIDNELRDTLMGFRIQTLR